MNNQLPKWLSWTIVLTVFFGALYFLSISSAPAQPAGVNLPAPPLSGSLVDGSSFNLSDYKGKVVLLNFWGTWCPPCRAELPDLIKLQKEYGSQGFTIVGLASNHDPGLNDAQYRATLSKFIAQAGITYPNLPIPSGAEQSYAIEAFPSTFLVDKTGTIVYVQVGMIEPDDISGRIKKLL